MERDLIVREVRQLAAALSRVLLHMQMKQYDEAVDEIDRSIARIGLVVPDKLIRFSRQELTDHLTLRGVIDAEYGSTLAMLVKQRGIAFVESDNTAQAGSCFQCARMILELIRESPSESIPFDLADRIDSLRKLEDELSE